ncbi:site-specific integrase [Siphonobacter curvatus]|uniref:Tyr recombinase domain-containing protein n=1 Tax=Siphonobacter curvatus TaxID=2094562 RepID=A0A2S7INY6_9BACT|nr:site-specific integrase [Siphonobacter curvatus]PQA59427.1 hypothetical protein C5O19_07180 [Siphonobacter curvatus]
MIVKYNVRFDRKKEVQRKGKALVQIEAYLEGNRRYFSTGIYLSANEWNAKKNEAKDPYLQNQIRNKINDLIDFERKRSFLSRIFILEDFDLLVKKKDQNLIEQDNILSFTQFYSDQLKARSNKIKYSTYRNQHFCLELLKEFKEIIFFEDLTFAFIDSFSLFLSRKKYKTHTVNKRLKQLRTYIRLAIKYKHLQINPFEDFEMPKGVSNRSYLIIEELQALEALSFTTEEKRFERVRDMFLFSVYAGGTRFSDVSTLTSNNFIESTEGLILHLKAQKTNKIFDLPLRLLFEGKAEKIAIKYWPKNDSQRLFRLSNPYVNKVLKILAQRAGIKKHLIFHTARHTAGTILVNKIGVLPTKNILQHSKIDTTNLYLHLTNSERNKILKNIKNWD